MTDLETIYSCNKWELDAILEGLHYRQIEEAERLVELALNLRYTLNSKTVKYSKMSKDKQRQRVKQAFRLQHSQAAISSKNHFIKSIERLNAHFQNR